MKRLFLSLVLTFGLLAGWVGAQTLVYGQSGLPVTLDSAAAQDGNSLAVSYQVAENLVGFEAGTTTLAPALATEWSANEDSSVWTFKLREGVNFHDGTPFNAEAVKFNFDRWNDRSNPYHFTKDYTGWTYVSGGYLGEGSVLEEVRVVDDTTVEFHLTDSVGFFPAMVAASYLGLDSPTAVMEAGENYGTPGVGLVGTGPFSFGEWVEGERVVLERNDDYWAGQPEVERLIFRGIQDPTARLAELRAGSVDIAIELSPDDLSVVESDSNLVPVQQTGLNIGYLALHQGAAEPLQDQRVREAIAVAVDWQAIVDSFYAGLGSVATQFVPEPFFGRSDNIEGYSYDPERARELLAEAGYENGFDTEFWYMPVSRPYYPSPESIASAIASYLAEVGINVDLKTEDWGVYLTKYYAGDYPMYMLGWSPDYPDPDNYMFTFFGPGETGQARYGWDNPEVIDMLNRARTSPDQEERAQLYEQVNEIVHEQIPAIPVAHNNPLHATRVGVEGWVPSPLGSSVQLWRVSKDSN